MMLLLGHRPPAHHATSYSRIDQTITITYLPTYHVKCQTSYLNCIKVQDRPEKNGKEAPV